MFKKIMGFIVMCFVMALSIITVLAENTNPVYYFDDFSDRKIETYGISTLSNTRIYDLGGAHRGAIDSGRLKLTGTNGNDRYDLRSSNYSIAGATNPYSNPYSYAVAYDVEIDPTSPGSNMDFAVKLDSSGTRIHIWYASNEFKLSLRVNSSAPLATYATPLQKGVKYRITAVIDRTSQTEARYRVYIDNASSAALDFTRTNLTSSNIPEFSFGGANTWSPSTNIVYIDNFGIYQKETLRPIRINGVEYSSYNPSVFEYSIKIERDASKPVVEAIAFDGTSPTVTDTSSAQTTVSYGDRIYTFNFINQPDPVIFFDDYFDKYVNFGIKNISGVDIYDIGGSGHYSIGSDDRLRLNGMDWNRSITLKSQYNVLPNGVRSYAVSYDMEIDNSATVNNFALRLDTKNTYIVLGSDLTLRLHNNWTQLQKYSTPLVKGTVYHIRAVVDRISDTHCRYRVYIDNSTTAALDFTRTDLDSLTVQSISFYGLNDPVAPTGPIYIDNLRFGYRDVIDSIYFGSKRFADFNPNVYSYTVEMDKEAQSKPIVAAITADGSSATVTNVSDYITKVTYEGRVYIFNFVRANVSIDGMIFYKTTAFPHAFDKQISIPSSGPLKITGTITPFNTNLNGNSSKLIVAVKDVDNLLKDVKVYDATIGTAFDIEYSYMPGYTPVTGDSITVFLWNSIDTMEPHTFIRSLIK